MNYKSNKFHNYKKKPILGVWLLFAIVIIIISFLSLFVFRWFWLIVLPISFLVAIAFQAMSEHFWTSEKYCPRCNARISIYSEYCRNCGLKLIVKCPSCEKYLHPQLEICDRCGYKFPSKEKESELIEYEVLKKSSKLIEKANFCSKCGVKLKEEEGILDICPFCGGQIE